MDLNFYNPQQVGKDQTLDEILNTIQMYFWVQITTLNSYRHLLPTRPRFQFIFLQVPLHLPQHQDHQVYLFILQLEKSLLIKDLLKMKWTKIKIKTYLSCFLLINLLFIFEFNYHFLVILSVLKLNLILNDFLLYLIHFAFHLYYLQKLRSIINFDSLIISFYNWYYCSCLSVGLIEFQLFVLVC